MTITLHNGDCLEFMRDMDANSVDAVVTDPPAGISFMGKAWDSDKGGRDKWIAWMSEIAVECLRVLKPGGYALVWALPRTSHWTGMAWENGGFEPRDRIAYCFGSGFPKSLDVSKAIDKAAGAEREVTGINKAAIRNPKRNTTWTGDVWGDNGATITAPSTHAAREWAGWGTALKPAIEDWWVFRKPLSKATVSANVLRWGCGALNIDASRVGFSGNGDGEWNSTPGKGTQGRPPKGQANAYGYYGNNAQPKDGIRYTSAGRFPSHLITDGSPEVVAMFPSPHGAGSARDSIRESCKAGMFGLSGGDGHRMGDAGSASRFFAVCPLDEGDYPPLFYCAKASKRERDAGLDELPEKRVSYMNTHNGNPEEGEEWQPIDDRTGEPRNRFAATMRNGHPTVKPLSLMRYLITLCTRDGATVLDPFMGSGTTGMACVQLGRSFIGCELDADYFKIAGARIKAAMPTEIELPLFAEAQ